MMGGSRRAGLDAGLLGSGVGTCLAASFPYYTCVFSPEKRGCRCVQSSKIHWRVGTGERSQLTLFKTQDARASSLISFLRHDLHKR